MDAHVGKNQSDAVMQYKIGHGKPLGLGDVKITVDSIETRRFDSTGYRISYPRADNGGNNKNAMAAHQWFKANRETGQESGRGTKNGGSFNWDVQYTLPRVGEKEHSLPGFISGSLGKSSGYQTKPSDPGGLQITSALLTNPRSTNAERKNSENQLLHGFRCRSCLLSWNDGESPHPHAGPEKEA